MISDKMHKQNRDSSDSSISPESNLIPQIVAPGKKPLPATHAGRNYGYNLVMAPFPSLGNHWDKLLGFAGLKIS